MAKFRGGHAPTLKPPVEGPEFSKVLHRKTGTETRIKPARLLQVEIGFFFGPHSSRFPGRLLVFPASTVPGTRTPVYQGRRAEAQTSRENLVPAPPQGTEKPARPVLQPQMGIRILLDKIVCYGANLGPCTAPHVSFKFGLGKRWELCPTSLPLASLTQRGSGMQSLRSQPVCGSVLRGLPSAMGGQIQGTQPNTVY